MGKKSPGVTEQKCQSVTRLHELSLKEGWNYSIRALCKLFKLNRAWYYEWKARLAQTAKEEAALKPIVETIVKDFSGYGVRRVTRQLQKQGYKLGCRRVRRLLNQWGLTVATTQKTQNGDNCARPNGDWGGKQISLS